MKYTQEGPPRPNVYELQMKHIWNGERQVHPHSHSVYRRRKGVEERSRATIFRDRKGIDVHLCCYRSAISDYYDIRRGGGNVTSYSNNCHSIYLVAGKYHIYERQKY